MPSIDSGSAGQFLAAWLILCAASALPLQGQRSSRSSWPSFAGGAQHTAISPARAQDLLRIRWQTPVDLDPQYSANDDLLIHYGSPLVTAANTVLVPVKTGPAGNFRVDARHGADGSLVWTLPTDYTLPPHNWVPVFGPVLARGSRLYFPGGGGTVYYRDAPDSADGALGQLAFFGIDNYRTDPALFDANLIINTPLTADRNGAIYFGFEVFGDLPGGLVSGIARIGPDGDGAWISVTDAAADVGMTQVVTNCTLALSPDFRTLYAAVSNSAAGYLVALDSRTLAPRAAVPLLDPATGQLAVLNNNSSASPTVGPDGDVYYGVLESSFENHERGWLLHFDATLSQAKTPAAFGWDATPSVIPRAMAPSYTGDSPYLLMTKYNNYAQAGGDGINRIAVLDPNAAAVDPVTGLPVMQEVLSATGPTPDGPPPAVKEWCVNSAAVDPAGNSVFAVNEDGRLYRWDLAADSLTQQIVLTSGVGAAYTPTAIGPDGTVYAIGNATLFAVGQ